MVSFISSIPSPQGVFKEWVSKKLHKTVFLGFGPDGGTTPYVDPVKNKEALKTLEAIGGEKLAIQTSNKDLLHGMYFNSKDFEFQLSNILQVKDKRIVLKEESEIPEDKKVFAKAVKSLYMDQTLLSYPLDHYKKLPKRDEGDSQPTVIICTGSGVWFSVYKSLIAKLLLSGINVLTFNYRGYEQSEGFPTDAKLIDDVESCHRYLKREYGLKKQDLLVYGSCFGAGPASALAKNHPGVNLFIDRSFSDFRNVARDQMAESRWASLVHKIMPAIVNFNVGRNLEQVKGHVGVMVAFKDEFISQDETERLLGHMPNNSNRVYMNIMTDCGHSGNWLNLSDESNRETIKGFDNFLVQANLKRRFSFLT
jgi:pimeloyl-ACP methyl ester carboxylesterase